MPFLFMLLNTFWIILLAVVTGWAISPQPLIKSSKIISWSFWYGLGLCFIVLSSLALVYHNIAGHWVWICLLSLGVYRFICLRFSLSWPNWLGRKQNTHFEKNLKQDWKESWSVNKTAWALACIVLSVLFLFYAPFLPKLTSGFYSISGGDHSIYMRVSEFFSNHGFLAPLPGRETFLPPYPNWNIMTLIISFQKRGFGYYSGNLVSTPILGLSFVSAEIAYTISIALFYLSIVLSFGSWVGLFFRRGDRYVLGAMIGLTLSNLLLWTAGRHSVPAFFAFSTVSWLILYCCVSLERRYFSVFITAILVATSFWANIPVSILLFPIPVFTYLVFLGPKHWKKLGWPLLSAILGVGLAALLVRDDLWGVLTTNLNLAGFQGQDFGLKAEHVWLTLTGATDFDIWFPNSNTEKLVRFCQKWGTACSYLGLFGIALGFFKGSRRFQVFFLLQTSILIVLAIFSLSQQHSQYAGIRFTDAASLFLVTAVGLGLMRLSEKWFRARTYRSVLSILFISSLVLTYFALKGSYWYRISGKSHHEHFSLVDSDTIRMAQFLEQEQLNREKKQINSLVYWFGSGPVDFASSEVLFRNVKYFEAYNYDYENYISSHSWWRNIRLNILDYSLLNHALFAVPKNWRREIIEDQAHFIDPPTYQFGSNWVYDTDQGNGAIFVGDAWNSPVPNRATDWVRYLKGRTGALVFWSQQPRKLLLTFTLSPDQDGLSLKVKDARSGKNWLFPLKKQREEVTVKFPVTLEKGMNILLLTPGGHEQTAKWGLVDRVTSGWLFFTKAGIESL